MPSYEITPKGQNALMDCENAERNRREQFIAGLEAMATFLRSHPDVPAPQGIRTMVYEYTVDDIRKHVHGTGEWSKVYGGEYVNYSKMFSPVVEFVLFTSREQVCRKVEVGVRYVEAHTEPVYEWVCGDTTETPEVDMTNG